MSSLLWFSVAFMVLCGVHSYPSELISSEGSAELEEDPGVNGTLVNENNLEEEEKDISTLLEEANKYVGQELDEPTVIGDVAIPTDLGNADPCTARGCKWRKRGRYVHVPVVISRQYSRREKRVIINGLVSFHRSSCIRFHYRRREREFLSIQSRGGCYSYVGRRGGGQVLSLNRRGCIYHQIVQHEILHALGFNHEQTRSDRDRHVRILYQNIIPGQQHNFRKINTINLGTPYDYGSVMHYGRYAFSRNRQPTIVPIPNSNVAIGRAKQMSRYDILRLNKLYHCGK